MAQFLDKTGLQQVWAKIKSLFVAKPAANSVTNGHVAKLTKDANGVVGLADSGYTIGKSVPSDAVFTDTHNAHGHTFTATEGEARSVAGGESFTIVSALGNAEATTGDLSSSYTTQVITLPTYSIPAEALNGALKVSSNSGTATQVITMNSGADRTLQLKGDGTYITGAVSGSANSAVVTFSHANPTADASSKLEASATGTGTGTRNSTVYATGISIERDAKGHVTGVSLTGSKIPAPTHTHTAVTDSGSGIVTAVTQAATTGQITVTKGLSVDLSTGTFHSSDSYIPTSQMVADYVSGELGSLAGALRYKGTIGSSGATVTSLPASHKVGDVYVVSTAGTYAGAACEVGDMIICKTEGSSANNAHWTVVNGENQVSQTNSEFTLGESKEFAVVDGTKLNLKVNHHTPVGASATTIGSSEGSSGYSILVPYITTDSNGHVVGGGTHTHSVATPGNGKLKLQGTSGNATETGFTANTGSDSTITFSKSGSAITKITTSGGTVTIASADSLKNPNKLTITDGVSGHALEYDGSSADTITFSSSNSSVSSTNRTSTVKFTTTNAGAVSGIVSLPASAFTSGTVTSITPGAGLLKYTSDTTPYGTTDAITSEGTLIVALTDYVKRSIAAIEKPSSISDRLYPIELDKNGKLSVFVPDAVAITETEINTICVL